MKAVLFDIDGTLIDSVDVHAEAWVRALARFGIAADGADMRRHIGMGTDQLLPLFVPAAVLARSRHEIEDFRSDLFRREYLARIRPFPDVPALLERCRSKGLIVALASSGAAEEVDRYAEISGVQGLVDVTTSASDVAHSKPCPDIFEVAMAKCRDARPNGDLVAAEVIVVGDTRYDVEAAARAGLACVGLLCGGVSEGELSKAGAVATFRDPADLLARYESSPLAG